MIEETVLSLIESGIVYGFDVNRESVKGTEWSVKFWLYGFSVAQYVELDDGQIKTFNSKEDSVKFIRELGYKSEINFQ